MRAEADLLGTQRRFMAALREPIFGESRGRSELPPRDGGVSAEFVRTAEELITASPTLAPAERLELYHRQYWYRLLDSLAEDFPGLRRLLGDEPFWRLLEAYLEAEPPRSFTLRHLGAGLADFIARRPDLAPLPVHAEDMARVEYALCLAFEAGELLPVAPEDLGSGALGLQPHVTLLALRTPMDTHWRASERGRRGPGVKPPTSEPSRFVAVYRDDAGLDVERLSRAAFAILRAIGEHSTLEQAMDRALSQPGLLRARDAARVARWFGLWAARGWLVRPHLRSIPHLTHRRSS